MSIVLPQITESDQVRVISSGLKYWINELQKRLDTPGFSTLISEIGQYDFDNLQSVSRAFNRCLPLGVLALRERYGPSGIQMFNSIMNTALPASYVNAYGERVRGSGVDGWDYVVHRDKILGLKAWKKVLVPEKEFTYGLIDQFRSIADKLPKSEYNEISTKGFVKTKLDFILPGGSSLWTAELLESIYDGYDHSLWLISRSE